MIRDPQNSTVLEEASEELLRSFADIYVQQVNLLYPGLRPLPPQRWLGFICQPFGFDNAEVDWSGSSGLQNRLHDMINTQHSVGLHLQRIVRLYDSPFIFMLKPDVQRFWLPSVALWDADETLADLRVAEA